MLEFLFDKVAYYCEYCAVFKKAYFEEHLWTTPSERRILLLLRVSFPVKRPSIKFKHFLGLFHENITSPNSFCGSVVFITKLVNLDVEGIALYTLHRRLTVKMTNLMGNRDIACVFYVLVMVVNITVNSDGS